MTVLGFIVLLTSPSAAAQAPGATQLTITVNDTSGARVADAAVVLLRPTDQRTIVTGADGTATIRGLATGAWTVEVAKSGFLTRQRRGGGGGTPPPGGG
jgi:hypothetical protein